MGGGTSIIQESTISHDKIATLIARLSNGNVDEIKARLDEDPTAFEDTLNEILSTVSRSRLDSNFHMEVSDKGDDHEERKQVDIKIIL